MSALRFLGLIYFLDDNYTRSISVAIFSRGRTESATLDNEQDQIPEANQNAFSIQIPLASGNVIQADNQISPTVNRRLSLEDFFLNRNQDRQEESTPSAPAQVPLTQFQVQQPDPNSVLLVRDAQFPSSSGGLISRLLMARRMIRLRRIARRLTIIPRLFGLGLRPILQRSMLANPSPLSIFSNRVGDAYDPREFVFGTKAFSYQNDTTSNTQQRDANIDQQQQSTREYPVDNEPYYNSNYDTADQSNYDSEELNRQQEIINSLTDEQQALLLQQLINYQQQLNQLQQQINNQNDNNINQAEVINQQPVQYQEPQQQNYQNVQPIQYQTQQVQQNQNQQLPQGLNDQQQEQIRLLQEQLLREQQLTQQLQQLQKLQKLQQLQQGQNLQQNQNLVAIDEERNQQQLVNQNVKVTESNTAGDRTEGSSYSSPIGIGGGAKAGNTVGVGINVGIGPPTVDVQVTKPVGPVQFPQLVNPIAPKPVPAAPVVEPLVPLGIFPKPMLNLKGRMFFGAEMGKGAGLKAGVGR